MLDRANYSLSDFLLFSSRVYYRMFELHNAALWPLQIAALILGSILLLAAINPSVFRSRLSCALLAIIWLFVAWTFFLERYATINWAAIYVAPLFVLQAVFLALLAARQNAIDLRPIGSVPRTLAIGVLLFSVFGYPFIAVVLDHPWRATEIFAIAPDPTATATLAILTMGRGFLVILSAVIPLLWITITALTLYGLGSSEFVAAPLAALACGIAVVARR